MFCRTSRKEISPQKVTSLRSVTLLFRKRYEGAQWRCAKVVVDVVAEEASEQD